MFSVQALAYTVWSFARVGHMDDGMFAALARAAERWLTELIPLGFADTECAFARSNRALSNYKA